MKKSILFLCLFLCCSLLSAQQKSSVVTKVTATWCSNCGTWGWDYFAELKSIYNNNPKATLLGVHHSGDLKNPISEWFTNNLDFIYQPQFYHNNTDLDVTRNNWMAKVNELNQLVDDNYAQQADTELSFVNAYVENNDIVCNVNLTKNTTSTEDQYLAIYVYENNVENYQSSRGVSLHPNVLREVISDNYYGNSLSDINPTGADNLSINYVKSLNPIWNTNNIGLLALLWEKEGNTYNMKNSVSINGIGLLSSSFEVLGEEEIQILSRTNEIQIEGRSDIDYKYQFYNLNCQLFSQADFNGATRINTSELLTGLYLIHVTRGNKVHTQQVFVSK